MTSMAKGLENRISAEQARKPNISITVREILLTMVTAL